MYTTYGKVQRGDVIDGHVISKVERWCAEDVERTRLHTADGGRRTECSDYPVFVQHHADPTLIDVDDRTLDAGMGHFAAKCKYRHAREAYLPALHGVALEQNRRRALAEINEERCEGHYDDDHALMNGPYRCDGSCIPR